MTPSMRVWSACALSAWAASIGFSVRTSTASLSNTSSTAARPLASSVAPVETRSQMKRAMPSRGASSTAPRIVDDLGLDPALVEEAAEQARIAGRDALPGQHRGREEVEAFGRGELEAAAAEAEPRHFLEARSRLAEGIFLEHVLPDDAEFAHAVADEGRDVVVADEHQVEREIFGARGERVLAAVADPEPGILEQLPASVGQAARLLDGDVEAAAVGAHAPGP